MLCCFSTNITDDEVPPRQTNASLESSKGNQSGKSFLNRIHILRKSTIQSNSAIEEEVIIEEPYKTQELFAMRFQKADVEKTNSWGTVWSTETDEYIYSIPTDENAKEASSYKNPKEATNTAEEEYVNCENIIGLDVSNQQSPEYFEAPEQQEDESVYDLPKFVQDPWHERRHSRLSRKSSKKYSYKF